MALIAEATKLTLSSAYLLLVILTIPLAFDVGGVQCGLLYSLTLFIMYFVLTTLRMLTRHNRYLRIFGALYYGQYIILPSLLMFFLNYCEQKGAGYNPLVNAWKVILSHCTPTFTILEGFCSLLLIQAVGQTLHWFTRYRSDTWLIVSLISSGCIVSASLYFLYRIYSVEFAIGTLSSSLLGSFLTLTFVIGIYGIISKKGSIIESSLLFAYIVKCIYETFPILSQRATELLTQMFTQATINFKQEFPKISPQMLQRAQDLLPVLAQKLPTSFKTIWEFLLDAIEKLTVPLMVNFAYRIGVFYAATKIIPSLYQSAGVHSRPSLHSHHPSASSISSSDSTLSSRPSPPQRPVKQYKPGRLSRLIYAYSPCIIIAVYTHLMLGYSGYLDSELKLWGFWNNSSLEISVAPAQFWNWVNMATTLALYAMELSGNSNEGITTHWKVD